MTVEEKLTNIFTAEFVQANADLDSIDAIYAKVAETNPEITKAELEAFLTTVSDAMHQSELSENDLDSVAGGIGLLAVAGGIVAVCGVFGATYAIGTAIGRCVYNIRHW